MTSKLALVISCIAAGMLAALAANATADESLANNRTGSESKTYTLSACNLRPFDRSYVDVALKEQKARQKVRKRCEEVEGKNDVFCQEEKAECTPVRVRIRE